MKAGVFIGLHGSIRSTFAIKNELVVGKYLSGPYMSIYPNKQENVHVMGVQANHRKDQA